MDIKDFNDNGLTNVSVISVEEKLISKIRSVDEKANAVLIDQKGESFGKSQRRESHHELVKYIGTENPFFHSSVMMRKKFLIETGGYNEQFRRSQDYDLWSRGIAIGEYHNLQKFLLKYRVANKISWSTIRWGAYSKFCHAWRQKKWLCSLWYPVRFMAGSVIVKYRPTK